MLGHTAFTYPDQMALIGLLGICQMAGINLKKLKMDCYAMAIDHTKKNIEHNNYEELFHFHTNHQTMKTP